MPEENSVFDFIYADFERINLLISQFNEVGAPLQVSEEKTAERESGKADTQKLTGQALVAKGEAEFTDKLGAKTSRKKQNTFDPRWATAVNFLDELETRGLISRSIDDAVLGQIVLAKGALKVRDFGSLKEIWRKPSVQAAMRAGNDQSPEMNRQQRRAQERKKTKEAEQPNELDMFLDITDVLPHTVQAEIIAQQKTWSILDEQALSGAPSDFALKYGGSIQGEWALLGVLEAKPDGVDIPEEIVETNGLEDIGDTLFGMLEPITRQMMGRPSQSYAIFPLLIFREIVQKT